MSGLTKEYLALGPNSVATRIGCVTCDQKLPGSNPVWVAMVWTYTGAA